ncbi:DNA polymerase nu [Embiotoca jacksoni]|uniref:DNA polymerase nu n=1 Tax=Embiotoca jacksoni TaxID=100190 RepID=UPI003703C411
MEQSSDRLYTGPLSWAAQEILAALRHQSPHGGRGNHSYASNHRQMERCDGSRRESWSQSSRPEEESRDGHADRQWFRPQVCSDETRSCQTSASYQHSQTPDSSLPSQASSCSSCWDASLQRPTEAHYQRSQTYSHRKCSEPCAHQAGRAPSFPQHEVPEATASFCHKDRYILSLQITERLSEQQAMPRRNSSEETRPSFILDVFSDRQCPDEMLFPATDRPDSHEEGPAVAPQRPSSCLEICAETDNNTSAAQREKTTTESWSIGGDETVASGGRLKWKQPLSDPTEEATSGEEDGGILYQQSESQAAITGRVHLPPSGFVTRQKRGCDAHSPRLMRNEVEEEELDSEHVTEACTAQKYCDTNAEEPEEEEEKEFRVNASEMKEVEQPPGDENKVISWGRHSAETLQVQSEPNQLVPGGNGADHPERSEGGMEVRLDGDTESRTKTDTDTSTELKMATGQSCCCDIQQRTRQRKTNNREVIQLTRTREDTEVLITPPVDREDKSTSAEESDGEKCPMPTLSQKCGARGSGFRAPCLHGNQQRHDNEDITNGSTRGSSSSLALTPERTVAPGQNCSSVQDLTSAATVPNKRQENTNLHTSQSQSHHPSVSPSFLLKRKHELLHANLPAKICLPGHRPKWQPPHSSQEKAGEGGASERKKPRLQTSHPECPTSAQERPSEAGPSHDTAIVFEGRSQQTQQISQSKLEEHRDESSGSTSKRTLFSELSRHKWAKCVIDPATNGPKGFHEGVQPSESQIQSKAGSLTAALATDTRVKDAGKLNPKEKKQMLERAVRAEVLVLTMVYRDGTTQLDPEQKLTPPVCGLLVLMRSDLCYSTPEDSLGPNDRLVYLKLEHTPAWAQQQAHHSQESFTRDLLLQVLSRSQLVVCYKAKDFLRTTLQVNKRDLHWKQVAGCHIQDPQVAAWLLDPTDPSSCYQDLLNKHCKRARTTAAFGTQKVSQIISGLYWLYRLNMKLHSELQTRGLWELYSNMELKMIPVLAAMESHRIHVDKEALRRTSDLLGTKMKQLEQEAHRAAGQIFLVTSNTQLRTVLFEKLRLHERCENKKLPKTINKQQQSTSEAALLQLQDLHPLPKIILEYRQVHKIKSTFVDGILSCMMSKNYISSTWYQTSAVTGRISAKHPNFQALPRQPLHITKKQYIQGKEEEVVIVHPRAMFVPQEGWTFLAADFCQVELRLLAHLSSDPELLRIFTNPQADVFTMLASQWKGVSEGEVTSVDREHAKRIVYSVVYGAGRERLSGILGVSAQQASRFQDGFLHTYRDVQAFVQRTIQQSHKRGYVLSIMGRRRNLPNINSPDWGVRMQAERQAVNFVVQGSAADLCKMAMIRIFHLVSSSSSLSSRLIAQLHDELLYEVEDSQVEEFAALVRRTMESLQHLDPPRPPAHRPPEGGSLLRQVLGIHV